MNSSIIKKIKKDMIEKKQIFFDTTFYYSIVIAILFILSAVGDVYTTRTFTHNFKDSRYEGNGLVKALINNGYGYTWAFWELVLVCVISLAFIYIMLFYVNIAVNLIMASTLTWACSIYLATIVNNLYFLIEKGFIRI